MKLPTEGELIELENEVLLYWERHFEWQYRVIENLRNLIALARDPSQLLQNIPDDDALDRTTEPPRRPTPKLSMVVQPKNKKRKR